MLGASGRTGRQIVEQALGHGHDVVAFVRDPAAFEPQDRLTVAVGDAADAAALRAAVDGVDAVVSALGSGGRRPVTAISDGVANAIRAMSARGVRRLVVVSAAGVHAAPGEVPLSLRLFAASPMWRPVYEDLARMEGDVMLSDLDWTIVRPSGLNDGPLTGEYRTVVGSVVPKAGRISRADVAALVLKCAEGERFSRTAVAVAT